MTQGHCVYPSRWTEGLTALCLSGRRLRALLANLQPTNLKIFDESLISAGSRILFTPSIKGHGAIPESGAIIAISHAPYNTVIAILDDSPGREDPTRGLSRDLHRAIQRCASQGEEKGMNDQNVSVLRVQRGLHA